MWSLIYTLKVPINAIRDIWAFSIDSLQGTFKCILVGVLNYWTINNIQYKMLAVRVGAKQGTSQVIYLWLYRILLLYHHVSTFTTVLCTTITRITNYWCTG